MNAHEQVLKHYGVKKELEKSVEELRELADSIESYLMMFNLGKLNELSKVEFRKDSIFEERADVGNILPYVDKIFNFTPEDIAAEMDRKMQRTLERIEIEKENK